VLVADWMVLSTKKCALVVVVVLVCRSRTAGGLLTGIVSAAMWSVLSWSTKKCVAVLIMST